MTVSSFEAIGFWNNENHWPPEPRIQAESRALKGMIFFISKNRERKFTASDVHVRGNENSAHEGNFMLYLIVAHFQLIDL
jgi:hypothetical protein